MNQPWILGITVVLYLAEAVRLGYNGQYAFSLTLAAYAISNLGIIWAIIAAAKG